jgi:hypothetical protein
VPSGSRPCFVRSVTHTLVRIVDVTVTLKTLAKEWVSPGWLHRNPSTN